MQGQLVMTFARIMSQQSKEVASCSWEDGCIQGTEQVNTLRIMGPREIETDDRCQSIHVYIHKCVCEHVCIRNAYIS